MNAIPVRAGLRALSLAAAAALASPALAQNAPAASPSAPPASAEAAQVRRIADDYLAAVLARFPGTAETLGTGPSADRWNDNTVAAQQAWDREQDTYLARLRAVDADALFGQPEWLIQGMLRESLEGDAAARACRFELWAVDQIFGWHIGVGNDAASARAETPDDRARTLARWRDLPRYARVEMDNLRTGLAAGYTAPRENVLRVIDQLQGMLADSAQASQFWALTTRSTDPEYVRESSAIVRDSVYPVMREYLRFLRDDYLPRARTDVGLWSLPNGEACYRGVIRRATSLDVAPAELASMARSARMELEAELRPLATAVTGQADLGTAREQMRSDPAYFFASREAKLEAARAQTDTLRTLIPRAFSRVPGIPMVVEAGPVYQERSRPGAWYDKAPMDGSRPATFWINLGNAERSSRMDLGTSTAHEGWPGHHLQIAWTQERPVPHPVMRLLSTSAFIEGWGMYAERVADEIGAFGDPIMRAGIYAHLADALVALEIDPGIHAGRWTREQAVDSMMSISRRPRAQAEVYADRHAATPGQLITYMTGYLEIVRLREQARRALGDRFDIRAFHDVVLGDGAVTLPMLRAKVERWIAETKGA
ncbi:DUF885 domain-containing protein [Longimicrobium sp.]|uniref:DUF885 domain-containing protein n=1 Tax=Longimicrobium sp. TaxID=2029185 RepID=UPI002E32AEE0|nr:DUF885 domain-containing protein [Longimicrobium sp.]HEX6038846.1 DUF885 domain-containing protein [Longimicrobium sp.]